MDNKIILIAAAAIGLFFLTNKKDKNEASILTEPESDLDDFMEDDDISDSELADMLREGLNSIEEDHTCICTD